LLSARWHSISDGHTTLPQTGSPLACKSSPLVDSRVKHPADSLRHIELLAIALQHKPLRGAT
jgi:hypothetical protein